MFKPKKQELCFNEIWDKWHNIVYKYCLHRLRDHEKAQDCMQNTFYTLYESIDKLYTDEKLGTWLLRVAENYVLKEFRNMKKERIQVSYDDNPNLIGLSYEMTFPEEIPEEQLLKIKDEIFSSLKKEDALLLKMFYDEKKKVEEISNALGISTWAIYKRKDVLTAKVKLLVKKYFENF